MIPYDTVAYAQTRLLGSIVRLGADPIVVHNIVTMGDGSGRVSYTRLLDENESLKNCPLTELNLDPVPLGYVNYKGLAVYLTRTPMRRDWRQGLRPINMFDSRGQNVRNIPFNVLAQTILGNFPKMKSCLEKLSDKFPPKQIAFSRDFSIGIDSLTYKGMFNIGHVNLDNGNPTINPGFSWAQEALEKSLENAA